MEAAKQPAPKDSSNPIDEELIGLLGAAIKASKQDDQGYASLNEVGQRAANRSSFDARNYGFSRLSELVEAIPNFATAKRSDGRFYVSTEDRRVGKECVSTVISRWTT